MFVSWPAWLRLPLLALCIVLNTFLHVLPLMVVTVVRLVLPVHVVRRACSAASVHIAESWIGANNAMFDHFTPIVWETEGLTGLERYGNYLVLCNHRSWVDILVLQKLFNRRIPFLRFFLKSELIWVPLLGPAWWALDFPFMKRYSKKTLAAHPELRGKDAQAARRACEKFRHVPVAMVNFVEGTRFTAAKHDAQSSSYEHLLRPRAGGVAYVLDAIGDTLHGVLDVTIVYPEQRTTMADAFYGRMHKVCVDVLCLPVTDDLRGDADDASYRRHVQAWLNAQWQAKDERLGRMFGDPRGDVESTT